MRARVSGGRSFWPIGSVWINEAERFQYSVELFTKNNLGIAASCRALSSKEASMLVTGSRSVVVVNWKVIGRVAVILDDAEMPRRHRKTVVETSLACSGDMHESGVKHGPASLVDVHSAEQHRLDDPSGLRDPKDQGAGGRGRAFERMTTQKG